MEQPVSDVRTQENVQKDARVAVEHIQNRIKNFEETSVSSFFAGKKQKNENMFENTCAIEMHVLEYKKEQMFCDGGGRWMNFVQNLFADRQM